MRPRRISHLLIAPALGLAVAAAGCSADNGNDATPTATSSSSTQNATPTQSAPATDSPTGTTTASAPATKSASPTTAPLTLFYVAVGDEGASGPEIGCGDSIIATYSAPVEFTNQVEASLTMLLDDDAEEHGASGLRNALAGSDLDYVSSTVAGDVVTVDLSGNITSGGTCDDPRIIEQLKYTAMTAAGTGQAKILVDGQKIEEVLSPK